MMWLPKYVNGEQHTQIATPKATSRWKLRYVNVFLLLTGRLTSTSQTIGARNSLCTTLATGDWINREAIGLQGSETGCPLLPPHELDDINHAFTFDANSFDFVHSRLVGGGINRGRWPAYLRDIKK
ncbi:MAG: hypothetical protein Q9173_000134 [Seirophora scorigena]